MFTIATVTPNLRPGYDGRRSCSKLSAICLRSQDADMSHMVVPPIACDRTTIRAWSHHQSFVIVCQAVARSVVRPVTSCSDWLHDQTVMPHTISICNRSPRLVARASVRFLTIGEDERYDQSWLIVRLVVATNDQSYHRS